MKQREVLAQYGDFMWVSVEDYNKLKHYHRETALKYIDPEQYAKLMQTIPKWKRMYYRFRLAV